jgi:hypothetical protein
MEGAILRTVQLSIALALAAALPVSVAGAASVPVPGAPGELRGAVTRKDGTPVTRFTVNGNRFEDPHGKFRILVPPEGTFRIVFRADGLAPNVVHVQGAEGKKLTLPDIVLGQGEDLFGEVLDASTGLPVVGAKVSLADPAQADRLRFIRPERLAPVAETGKGGCFELKNAPRGLLMLVVKHPDYLAEFLPVNTRQALPTVLLHRPAALAGAVKDASGQAMPGVHVVAIADDASDAAEAYADIRGNFSVGGLRPGRYSVVSLGKGGAEQGPAVTLDEGRTAKLSVQLKTKSRLMNLPQIELGLGASPATFEVAAVGDHR